MSIAALALVLGHAAMFGVVHEAMKELPPICGNYLWLRSCR